MIEIFWEELRAGHPDALLLASGPAIIGGWLAINAAQWAYYRCSRRTRLRLSRRGRAARHWTLGLIMILDRLVHGKGP